MVLYALELENEQKQWDMWLRLYPFFDEKNFMSFEEFKKVAMQQKLRRTDKTDDEIFAEMQKVIEVTEKMKAR